MDSNEVGVENDFVKLLKINCSTLDFLVHYNVVAVTTLASPIAFLTTLSNAILRTFLYLQPLF